MKNFTYKRERERERQRYIVDAFAHLLLMRLRVCFVYLYAMCANLVGYSGKCVYVFPSFLIIFDIPLARCANTVGRGQHVSCIQ